MSALSHQEIEDIIRDVQRRLDSRRSASGIALTVPEGAYRQEDEWLTVVVRPRENGVRAYDYVETLVEVDDELRRDVVEKVVLVPAMAD